MSIVNGMNLKFLNLDVLFFFNTQIVVTEGKSVCVEFCSIHFGHGMNLGRCNLTLEERAMIAGNVNLHYILL